MELQDYFRSFPEEDLVLGAELFFSGELTNLKYADKSAHTGKITDDASAASPSSLVSGKYQEYDPYHRSTSHTCRLTISHEASLPCSAHCDCEAFARDLYSCPHVAGLLTAYMVHAHGEDYFAGTRLETLLKNLANVENPFLPGVLKKTDDRLLSLMEEEKDVSLPVWETVLKPALSLSVECSLSASPAGGVLLGLRACASRPYLVKNLRDFLDAYRSGLLYTIGREEYPLSPEYFDSFSRKLLDYLTSLVTAVERGIVGGDLFCGQGFSREPRYMRFTGRELDILLELLNGQTVSVACSVEASSSDILVDLDQKGVTGILKKKAYGASFMILPLQTLALTGSWMYVVSDTSLFRINAGSTKELLELSALFTHGKEMYVRESDIGRLLARFSPLFQSFGTLTLKGILPENYEKETPDFSFYLDYTDSLLTCDAKVQYKNADISCPLYDAGTDPAVRNAIKENECARVLSDIFHQIDPDTYQLRARMKEDELADFLRFSMPRLEKLGKIYSTDTLAKRKVRPLPSVRAKVKVSGSSILMSLSSEEMDDFDIAGILSAYRKKKKYYQLKSGDFLLLDTPEKNVWQELSELYDDSDGSTASLSLPLYRALYLSEALEKRNDVTFLKTDSYRALVEKMEPEKEPPAIPEAVKPLIRPYQIEGFSWLKRLKACGFGGILADDMGLGKTLQVLSFILSEKEEGKTGDDLRTLVVCPASLVYNWQKEINRYTPSLTSCVITGTAPERAELIREDNPSDIFITSYDLLKRDITLYEKLPFANEFIDEAQYIKNQNTQASQAVRLIKSSFRAALTGTPIENHLSELWSIMDYLMPGFLYSYNRFQKDFEAPIVMDQNKRTLLRLQKLVHPFILRRLKRQVLKDLPEKSEETIAVNLSGEQKKLYDASAAQLRNEISGLSQSDFRSEKVQIFARLSQLREICCDPSLLYENYKGESAKLETCLELIRQSVFGGHKLLLFSSFTSMLDILCARLTQEGLAYHRIDGSVSKEKRMQMVDSFANDEVKIFCISLKAGGTGLNLTAADIVIHYDPWWNKAAQDQATDRTHRIGQTKTVSVYELICSKTLEERMQEMKEQKQKLADDILSGEDIHSSSLSREDLLSLLS